MTRVVFLALLSSTVLSAQTPVFDTIVRHGTVIDGTGHPRFAADIGIRSGHIAAIGDLSEATAVSQIDATGLFVAPGFINIHSHASPDALPTAVNMLMQGVTTEIFNADGGGPLDVGQQLQRLRNAGLAVNIGGYIGFNTVWQSIVDMSGTASGRRIAIDRTQRAGARQATGTVRIEGLGPITGIGVVQSASGWSAL